MIMFKKRDDNGFRCVTPIFLQMPYCGCATSSEEKKKEHFILKKQTNISVKAHDAKTETFN